MVETEMSKKILGQKAGQKKDVADINYLADNVIWHITKEGCGTSVFNGSFAAALMTNDEKKKALRGIAKFSNHIFVFERK